MCLEYVTMCHTICTELKESSSVEMEKRSLHKFKIGLITSAKKRFNEFIKNKNLPLNVRLGTIRLIGEMFNFNLVTEHNIRNAMKAIEKISKSSNDIKYYQYLFELNRITGYPPKPSTSVSSQQRTHIKLECPICVEYYVDKAPVSTKCGHIYCEACLVAHLRNDRCCPVCKQLITIQNGFHRIFIG